MITLGLHTGCIGGIFITGIFGNFHTKRGGEFLTFKTGIPGGLDGVGVIFKLYFAIYAAFKESVTLNLAQWSFKVIHDFMQAVDSNFRPIFNPFGDIAILIRPSQLCKCTSAYVRLTYIMHPATTLPSSHYCISTFFCGV